MWPDLHCTYMMWEQGCLACRPHVDLQYISILNWSKIHTAIHCHHADIQWDHHWPPEACLQQSAAERGCDQRLLCGWTVRRISLEWWSSLPSVVVLKILKPSPEAYHDNLTSMRCDLLPIAAWPGEVNYAWEWWVGSPIQCFVTSTHPFLAMQQQKSGSCFARC